MEQSPVFRSPLHLLFLDFEKVLLTVSIESVSEMLYAGRVFPKLVVIIRTTHGHIYVNALALERNLSLKRHLA